jgi:aerobic carbon-monoxide dehydrogenase medium subunit
VRLTPFRLHRPATVEAASELLTELGSAAAAYCGGTELLLVAKLGLTAFTDLVDLKGIEELSGIEANGELRIGAASTHRQIERCPAIRERWPSLAAMARDVANIRVRNVGTVGGNLCFADPHSDPATYLTAAGGSVTLRRGGEPARRIPIDDFTRGAYQSALAPGELLVAVHLPALPTGSVLVHKKMAFQERPAITLTANVAIRDGQIDQVRLAVGSIGLTPQRLTRAEEALQGLDAAEPRVDQLAESAEYAAQEANAVADSNGSVEYKRQLVRVLVERSVREALGEAASS